MRAKEVRELIKILEESNVSELEITRWWGYKIRISKFASSGAHTVRMNTVAPLPQTAPAAPVPPFHVAMPVPGTETPAVKSAESAKLLEIKAPMVGTFFRAPAPDAVPYIKEGDTIAPGKVLCIIEAMKLMNEIEAEVKGKIVRILVENGQPVEFNQTLFLAEPL